MTDTAVRAGRKEDREFDDFWWFEDPYPRKMPRQSFIGIGDDNTSGEPDSPSHSDRVY